ncbi:hypothetical protein GCM10023188_17410 [Pontibacter saemangeumensis]|uniref:Sigma-54 factor interaction domain-containing protein n=2 Tax=Pontibacter saemangeumensis TaxID=1084525 RepID=A0ABP8LKR2_9BACT
MLTKTPKLSGLLALKKIVEGTSDCTGQRFFESLVQNLSEVLDVYGVWVTEYLQKENRLRALAFWLDHNFVKEYEYDVRGTPCERVLGTQGICHIPDRVVELFPNDPDLKSWGAVSYLGVALKDMDGRVLGHLSLLDNKPMEEVPEAFAIFKIFASRAAAELLRLRYEKLLTEKEAKLNRLINGACEAIVEFNEQLEVSQVNQQAVETYNIGKENFTGKPISELFDENSLQKLLRSVSVLEQQENFLSSTWMQGQLTCVRANRATFPAEATLSRYKVDREVYFALFVRDIKERLKTQEKLKNLSVEAAMLREKVSARHNGCIIGNSTALLEAVELAEKVAPTNATVLIYGETGTGKGLIARTIHTSSQRKEKPLVTLNCAALPAELIESELFGHVKGAFTGAATTREGRFSLAHNGTIFLDEIGELPLQLQAKLLRVLQEGEFEPVGSCQTQKVNVRVVTATNRDLLLEVGKGQFREDLYYRLNVIPIPVPPLRKRGEDVILLAEAFIRQCAKRMGIPPMLLNEKNKLALRSYHWPGNVRELQNIIERGMIISSDGKLNLIPLIAPASHPTKHRQPEQGTDKILTEEEMKELELKNIMRALEKTHWKVSGKDGAAALLHIPSTTLNSRIMKLGIKHTYR